MAAAAAAATAGAPEATAQMGNAPPGRDSGGGVGSRSSGGGSPLLDPLPVGELPTPFSRFNEISKAAARQWRAQFQQRLADGVRAFL